MQSGSSEHMAAMRYGWDGQKIELLTVGGCTNDVNVVDFIKSHAGGAGRFLRDHIRTRTHTSVGNVGMFKRIQGGEEEGVRKHKT